MSSRGGGGGGYGRGRGRATPNSHRQKYYQTDENWTHPGPIPDHDTTSTSSTPDQPYSNSQLKDQNGRINSRRRAPRNINRGVKSGFVKKSDRDDKDSRLKIDSDYCGVGTKGKLEDVSDNVESNIVSDIISEIKESAKVLEELNNSTSNEVDEDQTLKELLIRVSAEEPELSEELLSINKHLQEDELLAMESIYGDNIFILDNQNGLKCFQVHIHLESPKDFRITANFNSSHFHDKDSSDFSYSFQVEYLSPIILTCVLPKSYPSISAPFFTISVQWLGSSKISDLCYNLDSIWQEQTGQEVIYQWVEWLHSCSLSHLGFDDEIVLGPYGVRSHDEDRRAISGLVSPDIDIPRIKSYNDEHHLENFCTSIQQCCICFSEFPGSEFIRLPCQHFFCEKCMKTFSDMHIAEGTVLKLRCPEPKCEGMIPPGLLKRLLGDEEFERWESLTLRKSLESMTDVVYCPRCETACLEDEENHAQCSKCYYSFCSLCREKRHVGGACMTIEMKLAILKERQTSTLTKDEQSRREQDMINQLLSVKEIANSAKQCPSCKMAISRTEGCNKMVCGNCGQFFCYRCNKAIKGYDHFWEEGKCDLFPADEIQRWEERMNVVARVDRIQAAERRRRLVERMNDRAQAAMNANNSHPCPLCSQPNVKVGNNNHVFCWACQNHYCYLCRKIVRRSSNHFTPNGCKQHTVG